MTGHADYLIVGSSHAALEAARAIRTHDEAGRVVMLTRDTRLPYSPTILPYVVSGRSEPERVILRDEAFLKESRIELQRGATVTGVDTAAKSVATAGGETWSYGKLLIATGAAPAVPPVPGLAESPFHVLRSMDDAVGLREGIAAGKRAVVLGAGLIGMHAAENLAEAGMAVTVVEMRDQVLPAYFDRKAAGLIESAFTAKGVRMLLGQAAARVEPRGDGAVVTLADGEALEADLLLVAAGVRPVTDMLTGSGVDIADGIIVDQHMRTSAADVWAAGDVAQAHDFLSGETAVNGILPNAVEQGRIAGQDMAGDTGVKPYPGGVPINTYTFFGRQAISVGDCEGVGDVHCDDSAGYLRVALDGDRLVGILAVDRTLDAGIMWQLILRRTDLGPLKDAFLARPLETGRVLMSQIWR